MKNRTDKADIFLDEICPVSDYGFMAAPQD